MEVRRSLDLREHRVDLVDLPVEPIKVGAEELDRELTLGPGEHLRELVGDRLLEDVGHAGQAPEALSEIPGDLLEAAVAILARAQLDVVVAVVDRVHVLRGLSGASGARDRHHLRQLQDGGFDAPAHLDRLLQRGLRQHHGGSQDGALVERRYGLGSQEAEPERSPCDHHDEHGDHQPRAIQGSHQESPVEAGQDPIHGAPSGRALTPAQDERGKHRLQREVQQQGAAETGSHREGRGPKHGALDVAEVEQGQEDQQDDQGGRE